MVTPIASTYRAADRPCSRRYWEEELQKDQDGLQMNWDGTPSGRRKLNKGDFFAAVYNPTVSREGKVMFYEITGTHDPSCRLASWSKNIGQSGRRVLDLSKKICECDWKTWLSLGGHRKVLGSTLMVHPEQVVEYVSFKLRVLHAVAVAEEVADLRIMFEDDARLEDEDNARREEEGEARRADDDEARREDEARHEDTGISSGGRRKVQESTLVNNPQKIVAHVERIEAKDHTQLLTVHSLLEMILEETHTLSEMSGYGTLPIIQRRLAALNEYINQRLA